MRKFLLTVVLLVVSILCVYAETAVIEGVGNPVSLTASEAGLIYVNTSNQQKWVSNSTTKGDWSKVARSVEDGSEGTPFTMVYLKPSDYPEFLATGVMFIASTSKKLMVCTEYTAGEDVATWTAAW